LVGQVSSGAALASRRKDG